jgi:hypothetical protein
MAKDMRVFYIYVFEKTFYCVIHSFIKMLVIFILVEEFLIRLEFLIYALKYQKYKCLKQYQTFILIFSRQIVKKIRNV